MSVCEALKAFNNRYRLMSLNSFEDEKHLDGTSYCGSSRCKLSSTFAIRISSISLCLLNSSPKVVSYWVWKISAHFSKDSFEKWCVEKFNSYINSYIFFVTKILSIPVHSIQKCYWVMLFFLIIGNSNIFLRTLNEIPYFEIFTSKISTKILKSYES